MSYLQTLDSNNSLKYMNRVHPRVLYIDIDIHHGDGVYAHHRMPAISHSDAPLPAARKPSTTRIAS